MLYYNGMGTWERVIRKQTCLDIKPICGLNWKNKF